ncbi:MAG: hypothetical protein J6M56_02175 [Clostridia bacterium]|nr:hypothetical protein [Clostridia bacterium]
MAKWSQILEKTALALAACLTGALALIGMVMTAELRAPEIVRYVTHLPLLPVLGTAAVVLTALGLQRLLVRFAHIHLTGAMMLLWTLLAMAFLLGSYTRQEVDFQYVCEAARCFARGDYAPLTSYYFNECSYQLGTCLLLEGVLRLVPWLNIEYTMQALNAVMSIAAAGMLSALGQLAYERTDVRQGAIALYLLCLPMVLYGIHVYGTLPMVLLSAAAMLCFALYIRSKKRRFGLLYALCIAVAYMVKMNTAIVLLALGICALLYGMESRDFRLLGYAVLGAAGAVLLARLAIAQYEWRGGVVLREDVTMLSRLVMGLQDGKRGAGWYNAYIEQFFDGTISIEQEKAIAAADLSARLAQLRADPVRTLIFFVQKALSQWLEPTYGTLLYGNYCRQAGPWAEALAPVFDEASAVRIGLEAYMKAWQQALYVLAAVGLVKSLRQRQSAMQLVLPVAVLGGCMYHMIFEAKSQYIYVYALYLVPIAGYGLSVVGDWVFGRRKRRTKDEAAI